MRRCYVWLADRQHDDANDFTIDSDTGEVRLKNNPDYEVKNSYSFTVVGLDDQGYSSEEVISLSINNVGEIVQLGSDLVGEADGDNLASIPLYPQMDQSWLSAVVKMMVMAMPATFVCIDGWIYPQLESNRK